MYKTLNKGPKIKRPQRAREYPQDLINSAIDKARKIPRKVAPLQIQKRVTEHMQVFLKDTLEPLATS